MTQQHDLTPLVNHLQQQQFDLACAEAEQIIAAAPEHHLAHFYKGVSLMALGQLDASVEYLQRACQLNPQHSESFNQLGYVLKKRGDFAAAINTYQHVLKLEPNNANAMKLMANCYFELENYLAACHFYQLFLQYQACDRTTFLQYVESLQKSGQLNKALEMFSGQQLDADMMLLAAKCFVDLQQYERALDTCQQLSEAALESRDDIYSELFTLFLQLNQKALALKVIEKISNQYPLKPILQLEVGQISQQELTRVQTKAFRQDLNQAIIKRLLFALAKYFKNLSADNYMYFVHKANRYSRLTSHYQPEQFEHKVSKLISTFDGNLKKGQLVQSDSKHVTPIFIVGMPRSGTTLIESVLANHSQIATAGETQFLSMLLNADNIEKRNELGYIDYISQFDHAKLESIAANYLNLLAQFANGAPYVIDKLPHNFLHLGIIQRLFPCAKIIHCQRDPIDTCLSIYEQSFSSYHDYGSRLDWLAKYYQQYLRLMQHWHKTIDDSKLTAIQYEHCVSNMSDSLSLLTQFIGLPYEDECIDLTQRNRVIKTASKQQATNAVYTSSVKRWLKVEQDILPLIRFFKGEKAAASN